ncbi:transcription antitermination factor NusB [Clostridium merdae]|uniref:transcription antitermination factor NusB n=1 Tax=Clostridium merdae TaxID=1958780 RepID=UPI000A26D01E|nr:transcription antitermination factor NusB [Clostridium merdae]
MSKGKMTRREEREQAFILVFQQLINRVTISDIIDAAVESAEVRVAEFAEQLALGVQENNVLIDDKIEKNIRGWSMSRLSKVSFALLRVAIYEILFVDSIPVSVSINEAVDLAKKYGGADDAPFINGVLGSIAKELEPKEEQKNEEQ